MYTGEKSQEAGSQSFSVPANSAVPHKQFWMHTAENQSKN